MRGIFSSKNQKENNDIDIAGSSAFKFEFSLQDSEAPQASAKKKKNKAKKKKKRNKNEIIVDNNNGVNTLPKDGAREDTSSDSEHEKITQEESTSISAIANETCLDKQRTDDEILQSTQSTSLIKFTESSIPTCDKKKRKKKKKSAKNKSKLDDSDDDFEHVINEFKSAHVSSYLNIKDSLIVSANPAKDCVDKSHNDNRDKVPQPLRDKSVPHFLSANDPELSEEAKRQAKYGNGKNLVAIGPAKKKDTSWLGSNKQSDSNLSNSRSSSSGESHHCSPFTFSFNGIL